MKRRIFIFLSLLSMSISINAQGSASITDSDLPPLLLNQIAPGSIQIFNGQQEGWWYLPGTALMVTGSVLAGKDYLPTTAMTPQYAAGMLMGVAGASLYSYSNYAWAMDKRLIWVDTFERESLLSLLSSPWNSDALLKPEVLPVVGMALLAMAGRSLAMTDLESVELWFNQSEVEYAGLSLPPWGALGLDTLWSIATMNLVAVSEEVQYRGLLTGISSPGISTALFGGIHALNLLNQEITERTVFKTMAQVANAIVIGSYLDWLTKKNNGDLSQAVAFHCWWNVGTRMLDFIFASGVK